MLKATLETIFMAVVSLIISYIFALPLASLTLETRPSGLIPNKVINIVMNRVIDTIRSIPFILLIVFLFPVTRLIFGSAIGTNAMIVPLTICAIPFEIRLIEEILSQVNQEAVEAAQLDGANKIQIIVLIKWGSKRALLVNSISITLINLIGQSAIAGVIGGGGLGNYAIVYGFQRYNWNIILYSILIIIVIVFVIQIINNLMVRKIERKDQ